MKRVASSYHKSQSKTFLNVIFIFYINHLFSHFVLGKLKSNKKKKGFKKRTEIVSLLANMKGNQYTIKVVSYFYPFFLKKMDRKEKQQKNENLIKFTLIYNFL